MTTNKTHLLYLHIARVWSLFSLALISLFFIGEGMMGDAATIQSGEWVGILFFPIGVTAGLILAWWREGVGGVVTLGSFFAFYIWHFLRSNSFPAGVYFALLAAPGLFFLLYWYFSNKQLAQLTLQ